MAEQSGASSACAACTAAWPDLAEEVCDGHSASEQALALQLAWIVQEQQPTPEQVCAFLDDAEQTIYWLGDLGSWTVERTGTLDHDPLWSVNGVAFRLRYDVDGHAWPIPNPPTGPCPECDEDVGRNALDNNRPSRSVTVECLGCFHEWTVEPWWTPAGKPDPEPSS